MTSAVTIEHKASFVRSFLAWVLLAGLVAVVIFWYSTQDGPDRPVTLITGDEGGLYHQFGLALKEIYELRTGQTLIVKSSLGSEANRQALVQGEAEIAIVQAGTVDLSDVDLYTVLYPEVVHIVVRRTAGITGIDGLRGRRIVLGPVGSGMRRSAMEILDRYHLIPGIIEAEGRYFGELESDLELDGAVVTTGIFNPDLQRLLATREFDLLPIDAAGAIQARNAHLNLHTLPMGVYGIDRPVPSGNLGTLASSALLIGQKDLSPVIVRNLLGAVYEGGLHYRFPAVFQKEEVRGKSPGPLAEEAELFFNPADRIGQLANVMESMAAFKELAFAFFAGLYLLWGRFRRYEERAKLRAVQREKDELDELLTATVQIEESQAETEDPVKLKKLLHDVTQIKLQALRQLTHEDLRGDRVFLIFLTQCANLISKIQSKLSHLTAVGSQRGEETK